MDKTKFKYAVIATDVVIFTIDGGGLKVLLMKMQKKPFLNFWAAPGGLIRPDEDLEKAAKRHLKDRTGVRNVYLEQLYTFGRPDRDPFGRVVSVAYFALIPDGGQETKLKAGTDWFPVSKLPKLAYDHQEIIKAALDRLRAKLEYTNIVYSLLPSEFTLTQLQEVYETILDKKIDKRNFRKKILSLKIVANTGKKRKGGASRPALLYRFRSREPQIIEII